MKHLKNRGPGRPRRFLTHKALNAVLTVIGITVWALLINMWLEPKIISPLQDGRSGVKVKSTKFVFAQEIVSPIPDVTQTPTPTPTQKPTPTPKKTPRNGEPTKAEIIAYIAKVFEKEGTDIQVRAINCFYSESGLREKAVGRNKDTSIDVGVAQVNMYWHPMAIEDAMDYQKNIDKAYQIYKGRGNFSAWYGKRCNV